MAFKIFSQVYGDVGGFDLNKILYAESREVDGMLVDFKANTMKRDRIIRAEGKVEGAKQERVKWQSVVADKDTQIADKDTQIADKDTQVADKDTQIADKDTQIADKDTQIADKDTQIADKDTQIADKDTQIADKDALIAELLKKLGEK